MWTNLRTLFTTFMGQRVKIGKLAESAVERYEHTLREFELFLSERNTRLLRDIGVPLVVDGLRKECDAGVMQNLPTLTKLTSFDSSQLLISNNLSVCNASRRIRLTGPAATYSFVFSKLKNLGVRL